MDQKQNTRGWQKTRQIESFGRKIKSKTKSATIKTDVGHKFNANRRRERKNAPHLTADHLGRQIVGRAAQRKRAVLDDLGKAEIGDLEVSLMRTEKNRKKIRRVEKNKIQKNKNEISL